MNLNYMIFVIFWDAQVSCLGGEGGSRNAFDVSCIALLYMFDVSSIYILCIYLLESESESESGSESGIEMAIESGFESESESG